MECSQCKLGREPHIAKLRIEYVNGEVIEYGPLCDVCAEEIGGTLSQEPHS